MNPHAQAGNDSAVAAVLEQLATIRDLRERVGDVFRKAIDAELRSGNSFDVNELTVPQKTNIGTRVEILMKDEFSFRSGAVLDITLAGVEADIKFSISGPLSQMIHPRAVGGICLIGWADDHESTFSFGVIRTTDDRLRPGDNRDAKRQLVAAKGRQHTRWLIPPGEGMLPKNFFLGIEPALRQRIKAAGDGPRALTELFTALPMTPVPRSAIARVGMKLDDTREVRRVKESLLPRGFKILCGTWLNERKEAEAYGVELHDGEWVSVPVGSH